jgi:hypothetical protein
MLYKVFMEKAFRERDDLVGFIQAPSIGIARKMLETALQDAWPEDVRLAGNRQIVQIPPVEENDLFVRLVVTTKDEDGQTGRDIYVIQYQATGVCLFHGREWNLLFRDQQ